MKNEISTSRLGAVLTSSERQGSRKKSRKAVSPSAAAVKKRTNGQNVSTSLAVPNRSAGTSLWKETMPVTGTWGTFIPQKARAAIDQIIKSSDDPIRTTVFASCYAELMEAKSFLYEQIQNRSLEEWSYNTARDDMINHRETAYILASVYGGVETTVTGDEELENLSCVSDVTSQSYEVLDQYETIALVYTEIADSSPHLLLTMKVIDVAFHLRGKVCGGVI